MYNGSYVLSIFRPFMPQIPVWKYRSLNPKPLVLYGCRAVFYMVTARGWFADFTFGVGKEDYVFFLYSRSPPAKSFAALLLIAYKLTSLPQKMSRK